MASIFFAFFDAAISLSTSAALRASGFSHKQLKPLFSTSSVTGTCKCDGVVLITRSRSSRCNIAR
jgi:hypothetical protein